MPGPRDRTGENARRRERNEAAKGIGSRPAVPNGHRCERCIEQAKGWYAERVKQGICTSCARQPATQGSRCADCITRTMESNRRSSVRTRAQFLEMHGGVCACCGETDTRFLTLDHVNNDGASEAGFGPTGRRYRRRSVDHMRRIVRTGIPDPRFQVLCWNCNCAKAVYGECPHREVDR